MILERGIGSLVDLWNSEKFKWLPHLNRIVKELLQVVAYIHFHGLVHLDIKPDNIVIGRSKDPPVKLIDFGLMIHAGKRIGADGSLFIIAPELFLAERTHKPIPADCKQDSWSLGITLLQLISPLGYFFPANEMENDTFITRLLELTQEDIDRSIDQIFTPSNVDLYRCIPNPADREPLYLSIKALLRLDPERRWRGDQVLQEYYMDKTTPDPTFIQKRNNRAATDIQAIVRGKLAKMRVAKMRHEATIGAPIPLTGAALVLRAARIEVYASNLKKSFNR